MIPAPWACKILPAVSFSVTPFSIIAGEKSCPAAVIQGSKAPDELDDELDEDEKLEDELEEDDVLDDELDEDELDEDKPDDPLVLVSPPQLVKVKVPVIRSGYRGLRQRIAVPEIISETRMISVLASKSL